MLANVSMLVRLSANSAGGEGIRGLDSRLVAVRFTSVRTKILATLLLTSLVAGGVGVVVLSLTATVADQGELIYEQALVPNQQLSALREAGRGQPPAAKPVR